MKYVITDHNKIALGSGTYHRDLKQALTGDLQGAAHIDLQAKEIYGSSAGYGTKATQEDAEYLSEFLGMELTLNENRN
jgi:hypothetical protein